MSGILLGILLAALGILLFSAQEASGLILVICGFVSLFTGVAGQQERKQLRSGQRPQLGPPPGMDFDRSTRTAEDETRAAAVRSLNSLAAIPVSIPMRPREFACFRTFTTLAEVRQMPRLGGGYMSWDALPAASDQGELYVTNRRIFFSGTRETRDIPFTDIVLVAAREGVLELQRKGRPCPTLFGLAFPRELAAYIDRARAEGAGAFPSIPEMDALPSAATRVTSGSVGSGSVGSGSVGSSTQVRTESAVSTTLHSHGAPASAGSKTEIHSDARPSYITCPACGSANGLSANFCQNCAAPITAGPTPTLSYPAPSA